MPEANLPQFLLPNITCLAFNKKSQGKPNTRKTQSRKTKKTSELNSDMTQMLE